jgi:hypothetical protein
VQPRSEPWAAGESARSPGSVTGGFTLAGGSPTPGGPRAPAGCLRAPLGANARGLACGPGRQQRWASYLSCYLSCGRLIGFCLSLTVGPFTFIDITTGVRIKCQSSTASGTLKSGSGLAGTGIGKITSVTFQGSGPNGECAGAGGPLFAVQAGGLPWHVNFFSYGAPKGVAWGTISHLHIALSGNGCTAVMDGTSGTALDGRVRFRYADSAGQLTALTTGGNLHWYDVSSGCLGLVNSGDPAALGAAYAVTPKQAITSP